MASNGTAVVPPPPEVGGKDTGHEIIVIPYFVDTAPAAEFTLPGLWTRLRDEGIFELFFHDHPDLTFGQFVKALSEGDTLIFMVAKKFADGRMEHMGMATLGQMLDTKLTKRAIAGFLFFKDYWNHRDADEAGGKILDHWFDVVGLDTIGGLTPKHNRPALAYIHRLGFVSVGEIPNWSILKGKVSAAVVS